MDARHLIIQATPLPSVECMHIWKPSVTAAAIVMRDHRFLMVEENTREGLRLNQPAGHLGQAESLEQAVIRETLEETAYDFVPGELVGIYQSRFISPASGNDRTYLRFAFTGEIGQLHDRALDTDIVRTLWMSHDELLASQARHRSPLVMQCVNDFLLGKRAPLSLVFTHAGVWANSTERGTEQGAQHD